MKKFKQVEELDDGLLEPEDQRGFTRGNSRNVQRGGGGIRDQQLGERQDQNESDGEEEQEGSEDDEESGQDLEDQDDDDSNF